MKENESHPGELSPYLVRGHVTLLPHWQRNRNDGPWLGSWAIACTQSEKRARIESVWLSPEKALRVLSLIAEAQRSHTAHRHLTKNRTWATWQTMRQSCDSDPKNPLFSNGFSHIKYKVPCIKQPGGGIFKFHYLVAKCLLRKWMNMKAGWELAGRNVAEWLHVAFTRGSRGDRTSRNVWIRLTCPSPHSCKLGTQWLWAICLIFLSLSFLLCEKRVITPPPRTCKGY